MQLYAFRSWMLVLQFVVGQPGVDSETDETSETEIYSVSPFCGIACLYAASRILGVDLAFEELVDAKYISSPSGSTLGDLSEAALDVGLAGIPVRGMTARFLKHLDEPTIIHVESNPDSETVDYDHFVLFLGSEKVFARVFDPPNPIRETPLVALAARWNGTGLIVSEEDAAEVVSVSRRVRSNELAIVSSLLIALFAPLYLLNRLTSRPTNFVDISFRSMGLALIASGIGLIHQSILQVFAL